MRTRARLAVVAGVVTLVAYGCSERLDLHPRAGPLGNYASSAASGCGISYTMVTSEEDSLMATYGIPTLQDTVNVCETWTGSDYAVSLQVVGSSEFYTGLRDTIEQVTYTAGSVAGFDAGGTTVDTTTALATTAFDLMRADSGTRAASYDSPYYAVYTPQSDAFLTTTPGSARARPNRASDAPDTTRYRRHGLTRKGVRALVDALEELTPSAGGARRFHRVRGGADEILSIDPGSQVLVGEESRDPRGYSTVARHTWGETPDGWVRTRTDIDAEEQAHGQTYRSHSTIRFLDVRVGGVSQSPIKGGGQ